MTDLLKFSIPGKPEYVSMVRMAVSSLASGVGFDVEAIDDIKVAVSEACTNVVRHGCPGVQCYEVTCEVCKERMIICIIDHAGGYDVTKYKEPNPEEPRERGLGIFIIRALMDEVDIFSEIGEGTKIKMVKYCSYK